MIRTLIADRVPLIRAGLAACLAREPGIEVVAELDCHQRVLPAVYALRPDVAVIDDALAWHDDLAVVHALHTLTPSCRTLILATRPHPRDLRQAVAAHAAGFVLKDTTPQHLSQAIRQVAQGLKVLDPDVAFATLDCPANPMTPRECDVLRLAAAGAPTAEIAGKLFLAAGTVRNHISSIIAKTGARNRVDAIRMAEHCGWL